MFYIKLGETEKGPLTIKEIKKLGINKTTLVRKINEDDWYPAEQFETLKVALWPSRKLRRFVFILFGLILVMSVSIVLIINLVHHYTTPNTLTSLIIKSPPEIDFELTEHKKGLFDELFKDCNLSGTKKQLVRACNYSDSFVRNEAIKVAAGSPGKLNLGQICNIFDYCYGNWKYVNDPKADNYVEYASITLNNGLIGDCDDFAVLVCSMILSIGGEAIITYAYGKNSSHAYTEVNIGRTDLSEVQAYLRSRYNIVYSGSIWTRPDLNGNHWLNLDWFATHPGGEYFDHDYGTQFYILQGYCQEYSGK